MYEVLKRTIIASGYNLEDMIAKISKFYAYGQITEAQYDELTALAYQYVTPDAQKADLETRIESIQKHILELEARIKALEEGATPDPQPEPEPVEIPEWQAWDGVKYPPGYQTGEKVTKDGKIWESQIDNNIYVPGAPGIYDNIWKEVTE